MGSCTSSKRDLINLRLSKHIDVIANLVDAMKPQLVYVELKTGYNDNGPAWIGIASFSKTGRMIYFNGKAFQKGSNVKGNHFDVVTGDEYWISGIKKDGSNRHWAGSGKIQIDKAVVDQYLALTNQTTLTKSMFEIVELNNVPPKEEIREVKNNKLTS